MNYRHAFHAGNHADVLKHAALLELCDMLGAKPAPVFALDTHAGRGMYRLDALQSQRTHEAEGGIGRIDLKAVPAPLKRYARAITACREQHGPKAYPGSPWLLTHALRPQDRIACCELLRDEAEGLRNAVQDPRLVVYDRDGYAAMRALLPPRAGTERIARGLVLIDPPYESQMAEYDDAFTALRDALERFPQATYVLWFPIKQRRPLHPIYRRAALLPARSVLTAEVLVRRDDSPLRMNGSGLLVFNAPWQFDERMRKILPEISRLLSEEPGAGWRLDWLKAGA